MDKNTHLITEAAQGAKYELAAVSSNPQIIRIVTPSWLISTSDVGQRAYEMNHKIIESTTTNNISEENRTETHSKPSLLSLVDDALGGAAVLKMDDESGNNISLSRSFLFEKLQFYLIGFESNPKLKQKINKLIRRGNGTIYWDMNEDISILILCDTCDDALQKAARVVTTHHSNLPPAVSPLWVIESYKRNILQSASAYPPIRPVPLKLHNTNDRMKSVKRGTKTSSKTSSLSSTTSNFSVFRGCLFSLVRSSPLTELEQTETQRITSNNVEFDLKEQEAFIKAHGGKILSMKLLDALRADAKNSGGTKRKCHIVCWGGSPPRLETNPLVSQLQRHDLCELILVTPIWVQTCVSVRKRIRPERLPLVLMPQSWSMKSALNAQLPPPPVGGKREEKTDAHHRRRLDISLTGFQGTEKAVIVNIIGAIGGLYHGNMSNVNTHLVFKKNATGLKLEKAIEWGLHVVSIQWLYHILEHGYGGVDDDELGCEKKFSLVGS